MISRSLAFAVIGLLIVSGSEAAPPSPPGPTVPQLTKVVGDVRLVTSRGSTAAKPGAPVADGVLLSTGQGSRAEVTFPDARILRAGSGTTVIVGSSGLIDLRRGVILFSQPPGLVARTQVVTSGLVTQLKNGTFMVENQPPQFVKFMGLNGEPRVSLRTNPKEGVELPPGRMLIVPPQGPLTAPVEFELGAVVTSSLLSKNFRLLPAYQSIQQEVAKQKRARSKGDLVETNLMIDGGGTLVKLLPTKATPAPSPTASPKGPSSP